MVGCWAFFFFVKRLTYRENENNIFVYKKIILIIDFDYKGRVGYRMMNHRESLIDHLRDAGTWDSAYATMKMHRVSVLFHDSWSSIVEHMIYRDINDDRVEQELLLLLQGK